MGGGREREAVETHGNYPFLLSYIHCGRDNLNEIWDVGRQGKKRVRRVK